MEQFEIAKHYDVMADLDSDVHHDDELSRSEAELAVRIIKEQTGNVPNSVFLPCFGTGRHINPLLKLGVKCIAGVDLSPACIKRAIASLQCTNGNTVALTQADLRVWFTNEKFDAVILLGNSFADIIDPVQLQLVTAGMLRPLKSGGVFVMDYVSARYLERCRTGRESEWRAVLNGVPVRDCRTPIFDAEKRVLQINVRALALENSHPVWMGSYQKLMLSPQELVRHFGAHHVELRCLGSATSLNPYFHATDPQHPFHMIHHRDLGMIQESDWWMGRKTA